MISLKRNLSKFWKIQKFQKNKISGSHAANLYKIKLKTIGYRLLYEGIDNEVVVLVVAVGRRDKIYKKDQ